MKKFFESKFLSCLLFIVYTSILTWIIIAKMDWSLIKAINTNWLENPRLLLHPGTTWQTINLTPYAYFDYMEVLLNIAFFIPLGIFIYLLRNKNSILLTTFLAFLLSLVYELTQYIFVIGFPDITDIIDNTLGGTVGSILIGIIRLIFRSKTRLYMNIILFWCSIYILYKIYYLS